MEGCTVVKVLKSAPVRAVLPWLLLWYVRLTLRLQREARVEGEENLRLMAAERPLIVAFWHETLPTMPLFWREARKQGMTRQAAALVSRHRDGQMVGGVIRKLGIKLVTGSSSKGGAASMQELIKQLRNGVNIGITPDGPRGPARRAAAGVAALAGLSGVRILPCGVASTRFFVIKKSWDRMRVPLPFGRIVLVCGAPITVPRETWREALPEIEDALNDVQTRAMQA